MDNFSCILHWSSLYEWQTASDPLLCLSAIQLSLVATLCCITICGLIRTYRLQAMLTLVNCHSRRLAGFWMVVDAGRQKVFTGFWMVKDAGRILNGDRRCVSGWNPDSTILFMSSAVCKLWSCMGILSSSICIRDGCTALIVNDACCCSSGWPVSNIRHPQRSLHQSCSLTSSTPTMVQAVQLFHCIIILLPKQLHVVRDRHNYTFFSSVFHTSMGIDCQFGNDSNVLLYFVDGQWGLDVISA